MLKKLTRFTLCALLAAGGLTARGDTPLGVTGRYWFDALGETHPFTPGSFEISTDGLDQGFHTLHAYVMGETGVSSTHTRLFLKPGNLTSENEQLTCTVYLDGKLYETRSATIGANGMIPLEFDMNKVSLGVHTVSVLLASKDGIPMGYRTGLFMRVPTSLQWSTFEAYYYLDGKFAGTVDVAVNNAMAHLDIDASALTSGLHSINLYMASPHGMTTSPKSAWFVKIPEGGEGVRSYSYWINDNDETLRTVDLKEVSNPFSLVALIDIPTQPFRSKAYTFEIENGIPFMYARNELNIRFSDPDGRVSTGSYDFTDTRVKVMPEDVATISNGFTSTAVIPDNTVILYQFEAEIGDSVNVCLDCGGSLEIYSPAAETLVNVSGADAIKNRTFIARQNGTYYVAVHDCGYNNSATVNFNKIHKFALLEQSVTRSANRGIFEMEVTGNGFESLKSLVFTDGQTDFPVTEFGVSDNYRLHVSMDLDNQPLSKGEYKLKGVFSDSDKNTEEEIIASETLTIEDAIEGDITVEIDAPFVARTPYLAYINVTNHSNVGVWGVPLSIAVKHTERGGTMDFMNFRIASDEELTADSLPVVYETADLLGTGESGSFAPMLIPYLGPNETKTLTIGYTTGPHEIVTTYAWAGKPWSIEYEEMLADDFDLAEIDEQISGNTFSFLNFCRLFSQLENNGGLDYSESEVPEPDDIPESDDQQQIMRKKVVRVAYYGSIARSSFGSFSYIGSNSSMLFPTGSSMSLGLSGSNLFPQSGSSSSMWFPNLELLFKNGVKKVKIKFTREGSAATAASHSSWSGSVPCHPLNPSSELVDCYQSGDPNDMHGYQSPGGTNYVGLAVKTLNYSIEFENDPELANAPASTINVRSTVDGSKFDLSSLRATKLIIGDKETELPEGHHFVKTLDMRPEINAIAELTFDFDAITGEAKWNLRSLDPLTLDDVSYMFDGILPVNDDSGRGIGYLNFSVDLLPNLKDGTEISSQASIIFDDNDPISTPVWTNVTDYTLPTAKITSQSTDDNQTFSFTVEGSDAGSGIWHYDLYMKPAGSKNWTAVKTRIEETSFSYTAEAPVQNVSFAVIATDKAGNRQLETTLSVLAGDSDGNGAIDANDVVATRNHYLGEQTAIKLDNADVTGDGTIDTQDATAIINLYLDNTFNKSAKRLIIK